jgi:hypothetical protein
MMDQVFLFCLVVFLSASLPLSIIAALGFRGSPFGKVTGPVPVILVCYMLGDGSRLVVEHPPPAFYAVVTSGAVLASVYAAANAMLLLTERRAV